MACDKYCRKVSHTRIVTLEIIQQYSFPLQLCFAMWCTRAGSDISFYKIPLFARDRPLFIWKVISGNNIRKFIFLYSNILDGLFSRGIAISWAIALWAKLGQILSLGCWGKDIQTRCRPMIPHWPSWLWPSLTEDSSEVWSVEGPSGAVFSSRRLVATTIGFGWLRAGSLHRQSRAPALLGSC